MNPHIFVCGLVHRLEFLLFLFKRVDHILAKKKVRLGCWTVWLNEAMFLKGALFVLSNQSHGFLSELGKLMYNNTFLK